jgi:hypothetical protein
MRLHGRQNEVESGRQAGSIRPKKSSLMPERAMNDKNSLSILKSTTFQDCQIGIKNVFIASPRLNFPAA